MRVLPLDFIAVGQPRILLPEHTGKRPGEYLNIIITFYYFLRIEWFELVKMHRHSNSCQVWIPSEMSRMRLRPSDIEPARAVTSPSLTTSKGTLSQAF
jgi:hypothetical protein